MYRYCHGGNAVFESGKGCITDLSANINPLGMPPGVREAIIRGIPDCEHYPDNFSAELREKMAAFEGVNPDWIFCGNGASDLIFRLPKAVKARKVLIAVPTFADYERSAVSCGVQVVHSTLSPVNGFSLTGAFMEMVKREKPELVYLCNPNNPTGLLTDTAFIAELLDCCLSIHSRLLVDECFLDFSEHATQYTGKVYLERFTNLIILKAFTKLFALPGIRLGYVICADRELIQSLYFHGAEWPVSNLSQSAGIAALLDAESFIKKTVNYVSEERSAMQKKLALLGYRVFESMANYVFLQNPYSFDLQKELDGKGIRIRSCGNFPGLDDSYYRIAISGAENNIRLLSSIESITEKYRGSSHERA